MSKYTTEVRFICENSAGLLESAGYSSVNEVIDKAIPKIFNFEFPIFDEAYRNVLCRKILKHYYTREIGEETVGLWKLRLDTRMNEIMPYYNQLYKSELLEFNPLYDTELTRSGNRNNEASGTEDLTSTRDLTGNSETNNTNSGTNKNTIKETSEGTTSTTNEGTTTVNSEATTTATHTADKTERDLYSDTPQGALTNVENEEYLTNARKKSGNETGSENGSSEGSTETTTTGSDSSSNTGKVDTVSDGETTSTGKSTTTATNKDITTSNQNKSANTTEEYLETVSGKQGGASYAKMLQEYRTTFLNIDMQVIEELSDLFINLW